MKSVFAEPTTKSGVEPNGRSAYGLDMEDVSKRIEKGVRNAKDAVSETLEDGKIAAERLLKRSRYAVEDGIDETARTVKRNPFSSLAIAFAAGAAFALLTVRPDRK
jgi:ElaB/YqjD/DUF883 family membrane-anchored ribosome-binding protein